MSEVTAEQLREALSNEKVVWRVLDGNHKDYESAHTTFAVLAEAAEMLANRPLTLAALQAGAEEQETADFDQPLWADMWLDTELVVLIPRSE